MKLIAILLLLGVCHVYAYPRHVQKLWEERDGVKEAPVFGKENSDVFQQRYFVDDSSYQEGGPIWLQINGEATATGPPSGYVKQLVDQSNGIGITLEHRFYGQSVPYNSWDTNVLKFLTVEQALTDLADFIQWYSLKANNYTTNKWITVGGSYAGGLSSWFRVMYPDYTVASWSSSGVVNAIYNFTGFDEQIQESAGADCTTALKAATAASETEWNKDGGKTIQSWYYTSGLNKADFFYMIADGPAMAVQYGHKSQMCPQLIQAYNNNDNMAQALADFINSYYSKNFGSTCFYSTQCLKSQKPDGQADDRPWRWQKCYELSYFQDAFDGSIRAPVETLDAFHTQCQAVFGYSMDTQGSVNKFNSVFGGANPPSQRVFYSAFSDDPWQRACVQDAPNKDTYYQYVQCDGCGHCQDMHTPLASDPQNLTNERINLKNALWGWLGLN